MIQRKYMIPSQNDLRKDIVNKYYLPTPFMDFSILKYEYRKNNCKYNQEKGEWQYED